MRNVLERLVGERGQSIVEVALVLPIALVLLGGALDMGRLFFTRVSIENAAREGAVFAASNPRCDTASRSGCSDPNTVDWRTRNEVTALDDLTVTFVCSVGGTPRSDVEDCAAGDTYLVTVSDEFDFVTPLLTPILGSSMTLEASATSRVINSSYDPDAAFEPWPTPTPTPTPTPSPTASPTEEATETPTPAPCEVPVLVGLKVNKADDAWEDAGFDKANFSAPGMNGGTTIGGQSLPVGADRACTTTTITVTP